MMALPNKGGSRKRVRRNYLARRREATPQDIKIKKEKRLD
jgi:hypothetical protein